MANLRGRMGEGEGVRAPLALSIEPAMHGGFCRRFFPFFFSLGLNLSSHLSLQAIFAIHIR